MVIPADARRARASVLYRDRFVRVVFLPNVEVGLEDARDCLRIGLELHADNGAPVLVDLRTVRSMSADARAFFAGPNGIKVAPAVAVIVSSPLTRAIGNFYLGFNRPRVPTKLFSNLDASERWLDAISAALEDTVAA